MTHVRVRAGLLEPKHVQAMGGCPLTLYLWLHTQVRFKGEGAGSTFPDHPYRHQDAAEALGVKRDRIRDWFEALVRGGYVTSKRLRHGLEVTISKYVAPARGEEIAPPLINKGEENPPPSVPKGVEKTTPRVRKIPHPQWGKTPLSEAPTRSAREKLITRGSTREIHSPVQGDVAPGADAPQAPPKPRGNPKVAAVVDALRAEGMTGRITPRDAKAIREVDHDPGEVAALYTAIFHGEYGDAWMHDNLSVALCLEKMPGWLSHRAGHQAPARPVRPNGRVSAQDYLNHRIKQVREEQARGTEPVRALPGGAEDADYHPLPPERAR